MIDRYSLLLLVSSTCLAGCSDDDPGAASDEDASGGDSGEGGSGTGSGSSSGGGGSDPTDECGIPGATVVASSANYSEGVIIRMSLDDDDLFFGTLDEIYSVNTSGGEPTLVYPPEAKEDIYPPFWLLGDELVVGRTQSLEVFPKAGGPLEATRELGEPFSASLNGSVDMLLAPDGKTFYAKHDPILVLEDEASITYWKYDYESEDFSILLDATPLGHQKKFVLSGDAIFTAQREGELASAADPTPDTIHRIPTVGGAAVDVPVTGSFKINLIGADDDDLYFAGRPAPFDLTSDQGGYYRVPRDGGAPEKVIDEYVAEAGLNDFAIVGDRAIVWSLGNFYEVPLGMGEGELLFSTSCEVHAMAASDRGLFFSIFDDGDETASILRVPLP